MRLVPLGTNGFIPTHGRQTMSFLVLAGGQALLLDAGSGVARLLEPAVREMLEGCPRLDILLTHYHLDHVVGLSYLLAAWPDRPLRVYAPGPPLVDGEPVVAMEHLLAPPLFPKPLAEFPMGAELVPYREEELSIGELELRLRRQRHPGGSVGVRIGDLLTYATDTAPDDATSELARGVALLLHEVWLTRAEGEVQDAAAMGHSDLPAVARIASAAGAARLAPVHHHPKRGAADLDALVAELARESGLEVILLREGEVYPVG